LNQLSLSFNLPLNDQEVEAYLQGRKSLMKSRLKISKVLSQMKKYGTRPAVVEFPMGSSIDQLPVRIRKYAEPFIDEGVESIIDLSSGQLVTVYRGISNMNLRNFNIDYNLFRSFFHEPDYISDRPAEALTYAVFEGAPEEGRH